MKDNNNDNHDDNIKDDNHNHSNHHNKINDNNDNTDQGRWQRSEQQDLCIQVDSCSQLFECIIGLVLIRDFCNPTGGFVQSVQVEKQMAEREIQSKSQREK